MKIPGGATSPFRVLAVAMIGLGALTGLVFPWFMTSVARTGPSLVVDTPFRLLCLGAGLVVGGTNVGLARLVVGRRLRGLAARMYDVVTVLREAKTSGDWSALHGGVWLLDEEGTDELGRPARAFNALILALEASITERQLLEKQLRHRAFHDPLTGLANRALFAEQADQALARVAREGGCLAVVYLDLDRFKTVNDTLGHACGDQVLVEVAARLRRGRRATDTVARLGGDEFGLLLNDFDDTARDRFLRELHGVLAEPIITSSEVVVIGASIGWAAGDDRTSSLAELLRRADADMYLDKTAAARGVGPPRSVTDAAAVNEVSREPCAEQAVDNRER